MSAERATYLDSSAIVKLVISEPESGELRRFLRRRRPIVASALARTEVLRSTLPLGPVAVERALQVLTRIDLIRLNDSVLETAGMMLPPGVRSLDAVHLATAELLGADLARIVTYDERMAEAARGIGLTVVTPS